MVKKMGAPMKDAPQPEVQAPLIKRRFSEKAQKNVGGQFGPKPNKVLEEHEKVIAEAQRLMLASDVTPLEIIMRVARGDRTITPIQLRAAEIAAPYVHPKLQAAVVQLNGLSQHAVDLKQLDGMDSSLAADIYSRVIDGECG
jgi:hypothetical protein